MNYLDSIANKRIGVLGLGVSGVACVSFLMKFRIKPFVMDGNSDSKGVRAVKSGWPEIVRLDSLPEQVDLLIVSPGIGSDSPWLQEARQRGIEVIGDIELFARINNKPVIAITGTNGKSTVTKLTTQILQNAGIHAVMGGNIGVPVLHLLASPFDVAVLELSSFQLETTKSLCSSTATILNCQEDHMDRYSSFNDYVAAKQRIYAQAQLMVYNRADDKTYPSTAGACVTSFGLDEPPGNAVGVKQGGFYRGEQFICPIESLNLVGMHNVANACAAIALVSPFEVPPQVIEQTFKQYEGLPHRCALLPNTGQVRWINDSKATNVAATVAAIEGIKPMCRGQLILIAGGLGKGQDFTPLKAVLNGQVNHLITLGQDGHQIARLFAQTIAVKTLNEAVAEAARLAKAGDQVLFSPACASLDMFDNFEHRGDLFAQAVSEVCHVH